MIKYIQIVLDYADKFFKRFKAFGYIIAVCAFVLYFINNGCQEKQALELMEKITGLNINNDILLKDNLKLDKALREKDSLLAIQNLKIDSIAANELYAKQQAARWKDEHNKIAVALLEITSDESYQFLDKEAYPYEGSKKYGFNERQVKGIHKTFLENENKLEQIEALEIALSECDNKTIMMEEAFTTLKDKYTIKETQENNLEKIIENKDAIIELTEKQKKRKNIFKKIKTFSKEILIPAGAFVGGVILGRL